MLGTPFTVLAAILAIGHADARLQADDDESNVVVQTAFACPLVGDPAPSIECLDDAGRPWRLAEGLRDADYLVLCFYPGDFGFCTTRQLQKHAARSDEFAARRIRMVGVSGDSVETHELYKQSYGFETTLLADVTGEAARSFGVPVCDGSSTPAIDACSRQMLDEFGGNLRVEREITLRRWTFVIDKSGTVIYRNTCVSPIADATAVLEFLNERERPKLADR